MKEIRLLHTADFHLDRGFKGFPGVKGTMRRMEILDRFVHVMELAGKEGVRAVLIAGDLFDNDKPSPGTIEVVKEQFENLEKDGISVLITPGTHDFNDPVSVWNREVFSENVHVFKSPVFSGKNLPGANLTVYGAANDTADSGRHIMRDVKLKTDNSHRNKVIMAHGSVQVPWARNEKYFPITKEEINVMKVDYVALGHYHSYYPFDTKPKAAYPGSPVLLDFEERKEKHVLLVRLLDREVSIDPVRIEQKYEMNETEVECEGLLTEEDLIGKLKPLAGKDKILRVTLRGTPPVNADLDNMIRKASGYFDEDNTFFHVIWKDRTIIPFRALPDGNTVKGLFVGKLIKKIDSLPEEEKKDYEYALRLGVKALDEGKI